MTRQTVAARLQALRTVEERHALLNELAAQPTNRWSRSQIEFYLPPHLSVGLEEYFRGERLVARADPPFVVDERTVLGIEDALSNVEALRATSSGAPPASVDEPQGTDLSCDSPLDGADIVGHALLALREEIEQIDRTKPRAYRLTEGRCIAAEGDRFRYVFRWSSDPELFMPGVLLVGASVVGGRVTAQGEDPRSFELLVEEFVGRTVPKARFAIEPSFVPRTVFRLLRAQRDRLTGLPEVKGLFEKPVAHAAGAIPTRAAHTLNVQQAAACRVARSAARSYIWGPPGTGKTTTLGTLVSADPVGGERVLVASPYNVAVDEAILAVARSGEWPSGSLVRVGRVSPAIRAAGLDLDSHLERRAIQSGVLKVAQDFYRSLSRACGGDNEQRIVPATVRGCLEELGALVIHSDEHLELRGLVPRLRAAAAWIRESYRAPADDIIQQASVVATTVTLTFLSPVIREGRFDHLVVDEASVLRLPEAVLLAGRVPRRITFLGDPRQLTAITVAATRRVMTWLKPNPFAMAGILRPTDAGGACVLLLQQHRMATPIRELVSSFFYDGVLTDGRIPPGGRLAWYDTSSTPARATSAMVGLNYSRENVVHRGVVAHILRDIHRRLPGSSKLVLSPFRAQKEAYLREANTGRIPRTRFATVHAAQGTESDVVILDLVVAPGRGRPKFLSERSNPELANLLNVAMSRARAELIIVGHEAHLQEKYRGLLLGRLAAHLRAHGEWIDVPPNLRWRERAPR